MSLSSAQRALYARHILLPEIGVLGQSRLCAASVRLNLDADPEAAAVAQDYLHRSGVERRDDASSSVAVNTADEVSALSAGEFRHATAALAGAFAAVETIKMLVSAGTPARLPAGLRLSSEES